MCQGICALGTDILYPRVCPVCDNILRKSDEMCCKKCRFVFEEVKEPRCKKCSKPLDDINQEFCLDCSRKKFDFTSGYALWVYENECKKSMLRFKYQHRREYVDYYVESLYKKYSKKIKQLGIQAFIPVPIHIEKEMSRGYNQARLIANGLGKRCDIPVYSDILYKKKRTISQKELSKKLRNTNLYDAFDINMESFDKKIKSKSIKKLMLIDDIYTTGNTIQSCAKKLKECDIKDIYFMCICIGRGL